VLPAIDSYREIYDSVNITMATPALLSFDPTLIKEFRSNILAR